MVVSKRPFQRDEMKDYNEHLKIVIAFGLLVFLFPRLMLYKTLRNGQRWTTLFSHSGNEVKRLVGSICSLNNLNRIWILHIPFKVSFKSKAGASCFLRFCRNTQKAFVDPIRICCIVNSSLIEEWFETYHSSCRFAKFIVEIRCLKFNEINISISIRNLNSRKRQSNAKWYLVFLPVLLVKFLVLMLI